MHRLVVILLIVFLSANTFAQTSAVAKAPVETVFNLAVRESRSIPISAGESIKIKGKNTVAALDSGTHLRLTGLSPGQATITVGSRQFKVYVFARQQKIFFESVTEKLRPMLGLTATIVDGKVEISGQLYRLSDWQDIALLADEQNAHYLFNAKISNEIKAEVQSWLMQKIKAARLPQPRIIWNPSLLAIVPAEHEPLNTQWDIALGGLGIPIRYEKSELAIQPLVRVKIVVAEINKKIQSQIGIEWPNMISAQIAPRFKGPDSLQIFLKAMEQNGLGQILASPNLLARSGSEADFLAGGEFPIKIITPKMHDVTWKRHGIYLKIKPRADITGRVSIELSTEVSLIDPSQTVDGIPGLKTNRMSTHFDLSTPRTIVLSGLIRQDWGQSRNGVWGLTHLPILGGLFRSDDYMNNKSELVIFVTPEIVNDSDEENAVPSMPDGWNQNV